ncbi:MAG: deiodinase-like protein, partial [Sedimentisphaerales bacterium]|nr:deiodinase-like protein [Sedimentisphaerales bacterium]
YNEDIEFLIVYIREAHPEMLREGNKTGIVGRPKNLEERTILASECVAKYKFTIPMVIDGMDGKVNDDYKAWPVRVTITDIDGKVAFYAGPGPFDFRIPPVERVLKKLSANGGRMPPPPVPQWGQTVNGLRCGLTIDPEKLMVGDVVVAKLKFENTTDNPINFYYKAADAAKNIEIVNSSGQALSIKAGSGRRSRSRNSNPIQRIAPGKAFEAEIEGKVVALDDQAALAAGQFSAVYKNEVNDDMLAQIEPASTRPVWKGKLSSGKFAIDFELPHQEGCIDCHGVSDYHHIKDENCEYCHVGEVGTDDFGQKDEVCADCHPRQGVYGRRQIVGAKGEFGMASKHISGEITDKHCLLCHDNSKHLSGVVSLIDPDSGGTDPWTGTRTEFCLTCHDGQPPEGLSFPAKSMGTGFDKLEFLGSALSQTKEGCSYCHMPHGSQYPALLKNLHSH